MIAAALLLALLAQGDAARQAREWVDKLGSDSLEDREEALRQLARLGKPALPELEKAAKGSDAEAATRAKYLLRLIPIQDRVTPRLLHAMPGVEQRLSLDEPHTWTEVLIEAMQLEMARRGQDGRGRLFRPEDLEGLVPLAFRGVATKQEKEWICSAVVHLRLRSAAPDVAKLLDDPIADVRRCALETLEVLRSPLAIPGARRRLRDPHPNLQAQACAVLAELNDLQAAPAIAALLKAESPFVRGMAARALARLGAGEYAKGIGDLLEDKDSNARYYAVQAVADLECRAEVPRIRSLLKDPDPNVIAEAIRALELLEGREAVPALMESLDHRVPVVQAAAAETLCRLGVRAAAPRLLARSDGRLESLNGVRRHQAWARLRSLKVQGPFGGTPAELRARLEKEAGLRIEWPEGGIPEWEPLEEERNPLLLVEALRSQAGGGYEMVVEADRLRFLPFDEARAFWSEWWAAEERR